MTSTTTHRSSDDRSEIPDPESGEAVSDRIADEVDEAVRDRPWLETVTRLGWIAKGIVYLLMGATAITIARQEPTDDNASPAGALGRVMEQPGGRVLLAVLAIGLVLYCFWRLLSVAVIRGNGANEWAHRIGYFFSAVFYGLLAFTAARSVIAGLEPGDDNTVEKLSRSLLSNTAGRWLLGAAGVVTVLVGAYFLIGKGVMRRFTKSLTSVDDGPGQNEGIDHLLLTSGIIGWIGRGLVTMLVGFFITRAAVRFDPDDARGFDRALRQVATTSTGTVLVWVAAIGLILYGGFCLLSHRRRSLEDDTSS